MSARRYLAAVAMLAVLPLAGCATGSPGAQSPGSMPSASPSTPGAPTMSSSPAKPTSDPQPRNPTPPGASSGPASTAPGEVRLTGQVDYIDIEGGCLVLRVGKDTYQLTRVDRQTAQPGRRVTVRGKIRTDLMTICQVGPVLEVIELRPA